MTRALLILLLTLLPGTNRIPGAENTAERLGFGPNTHVLIVHADDLGMSHAINAASIDALERGVVTSASLMAPCPWFPEIAAYARSHPGLDLGVHLTLTSEWDSMRWRPVAAPEKVPSLVDAQGYFWKNEHTAAEHDQTAEVEIELRAQIELALASGVHPTHLDSHMGVLYLSRDLFEVFVRLGEEYRLPILAVRPSLEMQAILQQKSSPVTTERLLQLESGGVPLIDDFPLGVGGTTTAESKAAFENCFRRLSPGFTVLAVHLGQDDPESRALMPSWESRHHAHEYFADPGTRARLSELGIELTTWGEVSKRQAERLRR